MSDEPKPDADEQPPPAPGAPGAPPAAPAPTTGSAARGSGAADDGGSIVEVFGGYLVLAATLLPAWLVLDAILGQLVPGRWLSLGLPGHPIGYLEAPTAAIVAAATILLFGIVAALLEARGWPLAFTAILWTAALGASGPAADRIVDDPDAVRRLVVGWGLGTAALALFTVARGSRLAGLLGVASFAIGMGPAVAWLIPALWQPPLDPARAATGLVVAAGLIFVFDVVRALRGATPAAPTYAGGVAAAGVGGLLLIREVTWLGAIGIVAAAARLIFGFLQQVWALDRERRTTGEADDAAPSASSGAPAPPPPSTPPGVARLLPPSPSGTTVRPAAAVLACVIAAAAPLVALHAPLEATRPAGAGPPAKPLMTIRIAASPGDLHLAASNNGRLVLGCPTDDIPGIGEAWIWQAGSAEARRLDIELGKAGPVAISPDGARVALANGSIVLVVDVDAAEARAPLELAIGAKVAGLAFARDRDAVCVLGHDGIAHVIDVSGETPREIWRIDGADAVPDVHGATAAVHVRDGVRVHPLEGDGEDRVLAWTDELIRPPVAPPVGPAFLVGVDDAGDRVTAALRFAPDSGQPGHLVVASWSIEHGRVREVGPVGDLPEGPLAALAPSRVVALRGPELLCLDLPELSIPAARFTDRSVARLPTRAIAASADGHVVAGAWVQPHSGDVVIGAAIRPRR